MSMDKVYLNELKNLSMFMKHGTQAIVAHDKNYAYKLYKRNMRAEFYFDEDSLKERLERLSDIHLESYVTPIMTINDERDRIIGFGMDFIKGHTINRLNLRVNTSKFIDDLKRLEEDTYKISEKRYELRDKNDKNIIYNEDGFHIIDLDYGVFNEKNSIDIITTSNLIFLNDLILKSLLHVGLNSSLTTYEYDLVEAHHNKKSLTEVFEVLDTYNNKESSKLRDLRKEKRKFTITENYYGRY
jgi:c-di-AMP phosphodiesterase-like protein